jgi:hypothetical protein
MRDFLHILEQKRMINRGATTTGRLIQEQEIAIVRQRIVALVRR